jgi:hypothetical protein
MKYRIYDNVERKYLDLNKFGVNGKGELIDYEEYSEFGNVFHTPENYSIEICSSIKDENGKYICEADIIVADGVEGTVWYSGLTWKIAQEYGWDSLARYRSDDITIIGNVHDEN